MLQNNRNLFIVPLRTSHCFHPPEKRTPAVPLQMLHGHGCQQGLGVLNLSLKTQEFTTEIRYLLNSFHIPTQVSSFRNDFPVSGIQFHPMSGNFTIQRFTAPLFQTGNEALLQNRPPMAFPQLVTTNVSQFQMQSSPCQGQHLQRQPGQKQETTIPPDLNLVFLSSGSPGRQSSGLQVDSRQPNLALQL